MSFSARLVFLLVVAVALFSCNQVQRYTLNENLFGVSVEVNIYTADRSLANRALEAVKNDLKLFDSFTDVAKSKPLMRVNSLLQNGEWFSINPSLYELITISREYEKKSGGLFNPAALGAYRQAWGFYKEVPAPDLKQISRLLKQDLKMADIEIDGIRIRGHKTGLRLDFGLLSLGYAIDSQLEHLAALGIYDATIRIGPLLGTLGNVHPVTTLHDRRDKITLQSGEAYCRLSADDARFPKTGRLDPRTAWPVKPVPTVLVIHQNAKAASVACAALSISGEDEWNSVVQALELIYAWRRDGESETITPALGSRLNEPIDIKAGKEREK